MVYGETHMDGKDRSNHRIDISRRQAIAAGAGVVTAGLAGCTGNSEEIGGNSSSSGRSGGNGDLKAVASFFSFYDFARDVADGTPIAVENLVPTGLHGHG